jgi:hypothetical protein
MIRNADLAKFGYKINNTQVIFLKTSFYRKARRTSQKKSQPKELMVIGLKSGGRGVGPSSSKTCKFSPLPLVK